MPNTSCDVLANLSYWSQAVWCNFVVDEANHCEHLIEMSSKISNWNSKLNEYCTKLKVGEAILSELMGTHEYEEFCLTVI